MIEPSPDYLLRLFREKGWDTYDMHRHFGISEAQALRLLAEARDAERRARRSA